MLQTQLILDVDERFVDEAGHSAHHSVEQFWDRYTIDGLTYEPFADAAMLSPRCERVDNVVAEWEAPSDAIEVIPEYSQGKKQVFLPQGGTAERRAPLERSEGFHLHLYLQSPRPGAEDLTCAIYFGGRYRLRMQDEGRKVTLARNAEASWENGFEGYEGATWTVVAECDALPSGRMWNQAITLQVLPIQGCKALVVNAEGGKLLECREEEPEPKTGHVTFAAPVRVEYSASGYVVGITPMTFAAAGTLASETFSLPQESSFVPDVSYWGVTEPAPEGASIAVEATEGDGTDFDPPVADYKYTATLSTTNPKRTPYLRAVRLDFGPTNRTATGANVAVDEYIREIEERLSEDDTTRELRFLARNLDGLLDSYRDRANLPVQLRVAGNLRFVGVSDVPQALLGRPEWLEVQCVDRWRKLQNALLTDAETYDGQSHTEVVTKVCQRAGLPEDELDIAGDDYPLPESEDSSPLWQPQNGQSAADFILMVRDNFSGWRVGFKSDGKFFYQPVPTSTDPEAFFHSATQAAEEGGGASAHHYPIYGLHRVVDQSQHRNEIWVVGEDQATGEVLAANYTDFSSMNDPTYRFYVGERRVLVYIDPALNTQAAVNWVCRTLADRYARFRIYAAFESEFDGVLVPGDAIQVDGTGYRIRSMQSRFAEGQSRTWYEVEQIAT